MYGRVHGRTVEIEDYSDLFNAPRMFPVFDGLSYQFPTNESRIEVL